MCWNVVRKTEKSKWGARLVRTFCDDPFQASNKYLRHFILSASTTMPAQWERALLLVSSSDFVGFDLRTFPKYPLLLLWRNPWSTCSALSHTACVSPVMLNLLSSRNFVSLNSLHLIFTNFLYLTYFRLIVFFYMVFCYWIKSKEDSRNLKYKGFCSTKNEESNRKNF